MKTVLEETTEESGDLKFNTRIIRFDGEFSWIHACTDVFDENSVSVRLLGTVQDIAETAAPLMQMVLDVEYTAFWQPVRESDRGTEVIARSS